MSHRSLVRMLPGILIIGGAQAASADIVIKAMRYSGKDAVWVNRFTPETIALDGNHKIISGYIWYNDFPAGGTYKVVWEGLTFKNYGSNPYRFYIGGQQVKSGRIPYPPGGCQSGEHWLNDQKMYLGTFPVKKGDQIKIWAESAYCTGLSGPGAYASFTTIRFILQGATSCIPLPDAEASRNKMALLNVVKRNDLGKPIVAPSAVSFISVIDLSGRSLGNVEGTYDRLLLMSIIR